MFLIAAQIDLLLALQNSNFAAIVVKREARNVSHNGNYKL